MPSSNNGVDPRDSGRELERILSIEHNSYSFEDSRRKIRSGALFTSSGVKKRVRNELGRLRGLSGALKMRRDVFSRE